MRGAYSSLRSTDQFLEFNVPSSSYKVDHSMNTDNESCPLCEKDNALITIDDDICCKYCGFVAGRSNQKTDYGGSMDGVPREPDHITEKKFDAAAAKSREDERKKYEGKRHDSFGSSTSFRNSDKVIYNKDHLGKYVTRSINWKKFAEMDESIPTTKHDRNWKFWRRTVEKLTEQVLPGPKFIAARDDVYIIFKKCLRKKLLHGRKFGLLTVNCIRIAMRRAGVRVNYDKVDEELGWRKKMTQYNHLIQKECILSENPRKNVPHSSPEEYVEEITDTVCTAMKIDKNEEISSSTLKILKNVEVFGKNPESLAAAAVYLSCKQHECEISIYEIEKVVKPSSTTIKKIAKELNDKLKLDVSL